MSPSHLARRAAGLLGAALLSAGFVLVAPPGSSPAHASTSGEDVIERYDMTIALGEDGVADVVLDLDVDFGQEPNRGPWLVWTAKQRFDETQDRVYRFRDVRVTSSTGASTELDIEDESGVLQVRVGEEDRPDFTGLHSYRFTFTVTGWVNSVAAFPELEHDELYLDVYDDFQVPISASTVRVVGPDTPVEVSCFAGRPGTTDACGDATIEGRQAVFEQGGSAPGEGFTVVVAYPAGTFPDARPVLQDRWAADRAFSLTPATGTGALVVLLGGGAAVIALLRRRGLDSQFQGLTPGLQPPPGRTVPVGPRRRGPVTVRFTPPEGFRPGQVGTLVDERADPEDVTATLVDLAVRGHLTITQEDTVTLPSAPDDWRLDRVPRTDTHTLMPYEQTLLGALFENRDSVSLSALRTTFATDLGLIQRALYRDVTERGWFPQDPSRVRRGWAGVWTTALVLSLGLTVLLAARTTWGLVGLAAVLVAVLGLTVTRAVPARTAQGTAVLEQAEGFRLYLATAEAGQIRFEEGVDIFSRYLPWAIAFGLTERWAKVFADLAAQGRALPEPTWYHGTTAWPVLWTSGAFTNQLASFTSTTTSSLTAPTPGSSGSSGSGGFSGGGVGGGGGGTW